MLFVGIGFVGVVLASAGRQAPATKPAPQAAAAAVGYVGDDTCLTCNDDKGYVRSAHGRKFNPKSPAATKGCESCHGPGQAHMDGEGDKTKILNPGKLSVRQASDTCTPCHDRATHALWDGSQHENRNVKCIDCHSVHSSEGPTLMRAKTQQLTCARCHQTITNTQQRFNHMPVREEKLACSSCHNVHGSSNARLLRTGTTVDESCTTCHTEKRGPYLWEHAPVGPTAVSPATIHTGRTTTACSSPSFRYSASGVTTSRHPPTVYEGFTLQTSQNANKIFGKSCANCHQQVHGSNAPSGKIYSNIGKFVNWKWNEIKENQ